MHYTARYAPLQPGLSGDWYDSAWDRANLLEIASFRPENSDHHPRARARLLYDERGLYGIFKVQDRYVRCVHSGDNPPVYLDSRVELYLQPKAGKGYLNFEFSCDGSLLCYYIVDPRRIPAGFRDFKPLPETESSQVAIYHSLLSRIEPEIAEPDETSHPHWASWVPLDELNFHLPRCFGTIRFEESS